MLLLLRFYVFLRFFKSKKRDFLRFYRAMHFSAYARSWDRMSSVRLSVCNVGGL